VKFDLWRFHELSKKQKEFDFTLTFGCLFITKKAKQTCGSRLGSVCGSRTGAVQNYNNLD